MNIIATICNYRPDLVEVQLGLCRRLCADGFAFVVGTQAKDREVLEALDQLPSATGRLIISLKPGIYLDGFAQLANRQLMQNANVIFLEEDVLPVKPFGFDFTTNAARYFNGHPAYTLRRWVGEYPNQWDEIDSEFAEDDRRMGEMIDNQTFYHLDKSSHVLPRAFQDEKWKRVKAIADKHRIQMPAKSWARIEREQTEEEILQHEAVVRAAYAGNMPEIQADCNGCG